MKKMELRSRVSDVANIPKDVLLGLPYLCVTGNTEAYIENYCGILEYKTDVIRIQTKCWNIHLYGKDMQINYYSADDMKVTGIINGIEYVNGGNNC